MFGDMGKMMKQLAEMKTKMANIESELRKTLVKGSSRDGSIEVELTGKMKISKVTVKDNFPKDSKSLEKAIYEAVDKALNEVSDIAQKKLSAVTGGIKLPGM